MTDSLVDDYEYRVPESEIYRDLVLLQGMSAQTSRLRRRRRSLMLMQRMFEATKPYQPDRSQPTSPTYMTSPTSMTFQRIPTPDETAQRPSTMGSMTMAMRRNKSRASAPIPLKLLLPGSAGAGRPMSCKVRAMATPPASPTPSRASINPRFSDAHVEYVGRDCVIHNGAQAIDIAAEFATQRAAPRLVQFPPLSLHMSQP
ncbi:hypothetical protein EC988_008075 [Linderina pennispora]|nr:hypothetical protein EC988_008075 [Linderina pennispora]